MEKIENVRKDIKKVSTIYKKFNHLTDEEKKAFEDIKMLRKQVKYEEARKIAYQYPDVAEIQSQLIKICMLENKYNEAKEIGEKFLYDRIIQSQIISIYINEKNYKKAKQIGGRFLNYEPIQSQMLTIFMKEKNEMRINEIKERFPEHPSIQSQVIKMYIKNGEYEKAIEIGKKFPDDVKIQSQMVTIHIKQGRLEDARKIGNKFQENQVIQYQVTKANLPNQILRKIDENPNDAELIKNIENMENKWLKTIYNCALSEKINIKAPAQQFIKQLKKQGYVDEKHKTIINALEQKLQQKGKIFDVEFYENLIKKVNIDKSEKNFNEERNQYSD